LQKVLGARHGAGERIAHAHGERGRRRLVLLHHVEMGVEGRDLVHLGERELHLLRQRSEMRGGEITVTVLDQVQVLDQEIAPALAVAQQHAHLRERLRFNLPALGRFARAVAPPQSSAIVGTRVHVGILLKPQKRMPLIKNKPSITIDRLKFSINRASLEVSPTGDYGLDR
jgi:hypothetical protein